MSKLGNSAQDIEHAGSHVGLTGELKLRDLQLRKDLGIMKDRYTVRVPSPGAVLLRAANGDTIL